MLLHVSSTIKGTTMVSNIIAQQFLLLFRGKSNTYVRNDLPKDAPAKGEKIRTNIVSIQGVVDAELMARHLDGDFGVGICPITQDGKCFFGVIDIDYYKSDIRDVVKLINDYNIPLIPFRSKSGGLHLYLMLSRGVAAKNLRESLSRIVEIFSLEDRYGRGKVEIFPKQNTISEGGFGSTVTLPYFNAEHADTYMLDSDMQKVSLDDMMNLVRRRMTSLEALDEALDSLPYNDAPPCIQKVILSGSVGSEDSGRNNFLFSYSIYAKKKFGDGFVEKVEELNEKFQSPLDSQVVNSVTASVAGHEYTYKCRDIPCSSYCDKATCRKREYGLGKDKGHFTGIEYGKMYRYLTAEPYYVWELRLVGQEEWKKAIFKDEGYLIDQRNFAKLCIRYLNTAPSPIKSDEWFSILNLYLQNITDIEVKEETDTSASAIIHNAFMSYIASKQSRRDCPFQIHVGLCVKKKKQLADGGEEERYYFTTEGFRMYLLAHKVRYDEAALREMLMSKRFGCSEDVLEYTTATGELRSVHCWSKPSDNAIVAMSEIERDIEEGDRAMAGIRTIEDVDERFVVSEETEEGKQYTEEDMRNAEEIF